MARVSIWKNFCSFEVWVAEEDTWKKNRLRDDHKRKWNILAELHIVRSCSRWLCTEGSNSCFVLIKLLEKYGRESIPSIEAKPMGCQQDLLRIIARYYRSAECSTNRICCPLGNRGANRRRKPIIRSTSRKGRKVNEAIVVSPCWCSPGIVEGGHSHRNVDISDP